MVNLITVICYSEFLFDALQKKSVLFLEISLNKECLNASFNSSKSSLVLIGHFLLP